MLTGHSPLRYCKACGRSARMQKHVDHSDGMMHQRRVFCFDCLDEHGRFADADLDRHAYVQGNEFYLTERIDLDNLVEI